MNAHEFVTAVARSAPSLRQLLAAGISRKDAHEFRAASMVRTLSNPRSVPKGIGELGDLFATYDPDGLTVGMVVFASEPQCRRDVVVIGKVEADPLVVVPATGEVQVIELGAEQHVLWKCSRSPGAFFDALSTASFSLSKRVATDLEKREADEDISRCTVFAGGLPYAEFWRMLLGVD